MSSEYIYISLQNCKALFETSCTFPKIPLPKSMHSATHVRTWRVAPLYSDMAIFMLWMTYYDLAEYFPFLLDHPVDV
jgi:hypothetical protein